MKLITLGFTIATLATSIARSADPAPGTCPGRGYVPYDYPSFDSCPCGADGCFHPRPYWACGGDADPDYKQAFWRRWLRAHFCGGSMLEGVPCHCMYPPGQAVPMAGPPAPALDLPPQPAAPVDGNTTSERAAPESKTPSAGDSSPFRLRDVDAYGESAGQSRE